MMHNPLMQPPLVPQVGLRPLGPTHAVRKPTKVYPTNCPGNHGLNGVYPPTMGFKCSRCHNPIVTLKYKFYICEVCRPVYIVCRNCMEQAANKVSGKSTEPDAKKLKQIDVILSSPNTLAAHAKSWFNRFDKNSNGALDREELIALCAQLNSDLRIPKVDNDTVDSCLKKFDVNCSGDLGLIEFQDMYTSILRKVRDRFGAYRVRRDFFLQKQEGRPYEHYDVIKTLGQGSFGTAELVQDNRSDDDLCRVMKIVNKAKAQMPPEEIEQEIINMKALDHPHVIKLFEYYEDYNNIYIVMEAANGGELLKVIEDWHRQNQVLNEEWISIIFSQVLSAISYCHARHIMHKDIKAENIMLLNKPGELAHERPHAVVIDLGLAEMFQSSSKRSRQCGGTPYTMAPEVWGVAMNVGSFGPKCDVYSLGCVLFHLLTGQLPVLGSKMDPSHWIQLIKAGPKWELLSRFSPEVQDLCRQMLSFNEVQRPTAADCFSHPWFKLSTNSKSTSISPDEIKNLSDFSKKSELEKTVLMQMSTQVSALQIPEINDIFVEMDEKKVGYLSRQQLCAALNKLGMNEKDAQEAAQAMDMDGNNRIDYSEFVAGFLSFYDDHLDSLLWKAFTNFDRDGSGSLDMSEIKSLLSQGEIHKMGLMPPNTSIESIMNQLDTSGDGQISFDEFRAFFTPKPSLQ